MNGSGLPCIVGCRADVNKLFRAGTITMAHQHTPGAEKSINDLENRRLRARIHKQVAERNSHVRIRNPIINQIDMDFPKFRGQR